MYRMEYAQCAFCENGMGDLIRHDSIYADPALSKSVYRNGKMEIWHRVLGPKQEGRHNISKTEIADYIYTENMDLYKSAEECKEAKTTFTDYAKYKAHYHVLDSWLDIDRELIKTYSAPASLGKMSNTSVDANADPDGKYVKLLAKIMPRYYRQSKEAVRNSLYYMFYKYGSGAYYVRIRDGKLVLFCYLWNEEWENPLVEYLEIDPKMARRYARSNKNKWPVLGSMVRVYEKKYEGYAMDFYYSETKYLLLRLCENYDMPDCDFIVANKDNVVIKRDLSEACEELVGKPTAKLQMQYKFAEYCPIFSFSWNERYADIPLPTPDDVLRVYSLYPAEKCKNLYINLAPVAWDTRIASAVFRGSFTGNSARIDKNPRLHIAKMNYDWKYDARYNEKNPIDGIPYLNAGLSSKGGFTRGRKEMHDKYIRFVDNNYWQYVLVDPLSHEQQMQYKYVIYIEGNAAAYRGAFLFSLGAVVLWVRSPKYHLWFEPYLQDRINCIFVKFDLSDLAEKITWLKQNDLEAKKIAAEGRALYDRLLTRDAILAFSYQAICAACTK